MAAQNLKIKFNEIAVDQDEVEFALMDTLVDLGFRFVRANSNVISERNMLFERDLTDDVNK